MSRSKKLLELCNGGGSCVSEKRESIETYMDGRSNLLSAKNMFAHEFGVPIDKISHQDVDESTAPNKSKEPGIWKRYYSLNLPTFNTFNEHGSHLSDMSELNKLTNKMKETLSLPSTSSKPASPKIPTPLTPPPPSKSPISPPEQRPSSPEPPASTESSRPSYLRKTHLYCFENALPSDNEDYGSDDSVKDKTYEPSDPKTKRSRKNLFLYASNSIPETSIDVELNTTRDTEVRDCARDLGNTSVIEPASLPTPIPSPTSPTVESSRKRTHSEEKYLVKPGCGEKCIKKCKTKLSDSCREEINRYYWSLNWKERRIFIKSNSATATPKRVTTKEPKIDKRRIFLLKNNCGEVIEVCKVFFLTTLGFDKKNDKVLYNSLNKPQIDNRGKHTKIRKIDRSSLDQHIDSFHPQISHYRREHAPRRLYLPSDITVRFMFADFTEKHPDIKFKYDLYRKHLKSRNISFAQLGNEECETCEAFQIHCKTTGHEKDNVPSDCETCSDWINHNRRYTEARKLYSEHKTIQDQKDTIYFSTDLEKVIMLPRLDTFKKALFCQRLTAYNQTFAPLGKNAKHDTFAVLWHDAVAGRKQEDIMSCFYEFLLRFRDYKYVNIWMDNCTGQNKNWLLFFLMVNLINSDLICTEKITFHYFEAGHTFMSCDHFHHQVELSMKKMGKIYDFVDFSMAVSRASSNKVSVKEMSPSNFLNVVDNVSKRRVQISNPRAYINKMTKVSFQRGSCDLFYENDYNGQEISMCFLKDNYLKNPTATVLSPRETPKGISKERKENIISKLAPIMPPHKLIFWKNLPISVDADI